MTLPRDRLRKQYYQDMLHHGAHALYYPPLSSKFKPGSCGYFDADGDWNSIVEDLSDSIAVKALGFDPLSAGLQPKPVDSNIRWGPKRSSSVVGRKLNLSGGATYVLYIVKAALKARTISDYLLTEL
jgi:hypothetical protein